MGRRSMCRVSVVVPSGEGLSGRTPPVRGLVGRSRFARAESCAGPLRSGARSDVADRLGRTLPTGAALGGGSARPMRLRRFGSAAVAARPSGRPAMLAARSAACQDWRCRAAERPPAFGRADSAAAPQRRSVPMSGRFVCDKRQRIGASLGRLPAELTRDYARARWFWGGGLHRPPAPSVSLPPPPPVTRGTLGLRPGMHWNGRTPEEEGGYPPWTPPPSSPANV